MVDALKAHIMDVDGNWGTSRFEVAHLDLPVTHIHVIAHENQDNLGSDGYPPTNHWSMYLQTDQNRSVHVDTAPGDVGRPGMIVLEDERCALPNERTHQVSWTVPEGTSIATILKVLHDNRRDHYVYAPIGEGCRFWLHTVAADFAEAGVAPREKAEEVQSAVRHYWPYPTGSSPCEREMLKGRFA